MQLKEYFKQQQEIACSDIQKLDLYQNVLLKNMKSSLHRKRSVLHVKSFVYSFFILFVLVGFYGMYFFDTNTVDDQSGIITLNQNTNLAQADYIAKIVDFNGTFYIEKDGKSIQTSNINN
jgi:hypothetical protein